MSARFVTIRCRANYAGAKERPAVLDTELDKHASFIVGTAKAAEAAAVRMNEHQGVWESFVWHDPADCTVTTEAVL